MAVKPIPDGYHTVTPYLTVRGASGLIEFLKQTFDAKETEVVRTPEGKVGHAELRIGDSVVMIGEAGGEWQPGSANLYVYVNDTDATYKRALKAGATSLMEPEDKFYGDRNAGVKDATGNQWWIATHVEDVSADELQRRAEKAMKERK